MLRAFLAWLFGGRLRSTFPPTTVGVSDWWENLPSGAAQFDDAEIECARHPCPYPHECVKRGACLRRA